MATIKSYTDIEQSRKLAEILPLKSADMAYYFMKDSGHLVNPSPFVLDGTEVREDGMFTYLNCWSLAALFDVFPYYEINNNGVNIQLSVKGEALITEKGEYLLDLAVNMIIRLNELNLL